MKIDNHQTPGYQVKIEPASWRDLSQARELEKVCFPLDGWPLLDMIAVLAMPSVVCYKAIIDKRMVAFVAGEIRRLQNTGWIATISVLPELRGQGLGSKLLKICETEMGMPKIKLSVRKSNIAAIEMYKKNGYTGVGYWPKYYKGKEDAYVMEKTFS